MRSLANFCKTESKLLLCVGAFSLLIAVTLVSLFAGSTAITPTDIYNAIRYGADFSAATRIFCYVRLPRTLACVFCGAALATSGAVIQCVLSNKIASPSVIGVNSGAGLAVAFAASVGIYGGFRLSLLAFIGATVSVFAVSLLAKKFNASKSTVILFGVAFNSLFNAITDVITTLKPEISVFSADFKIGDFSSVTYAKLVPAAIIISAALLLLFTLKNELQVLTLGEDDARGVGLNLKFFRPLFLILSALLAGASVSVAGLVSFVGLIVPHAVRGLTKNPDRLLPLSALLGAIFVTLCDTVAKTAVLPYELPVGIILSLVGVPCFIGILIRKKGGKAL